jgi:hypothetical protein
MSVISSVLAKINAVAHLDMLSSHLIKVMPCFIKDLVSTLKNIISPSKKRDSRKIFHLSIIYYKVDFVFLYSLFSFHPGGSRFYFATFIKESSL